MRLPKVCASSARASSESAPLRPPGLTQQRPGPRTGALLYGGRTGRSGAAILPLDPFERTEDRNPPHQRTAVRTNLVVDLQERRRVWSVERAGLLEGRFAGLRHGSLLGPHIDDGTAVCTPAFTSVRDSRRSSVSPGRFDLWVRQGGSNKKAEGAVPPKRAAPSAGEELTPTISSESS